MALKMTTVNVSNAKYCACDNLLTLFGENAEKLLFLAYNI